MQSSVFSWFINHFKKGDYHSSELTESSAILWWRFLAGNGIDEWVFENQKYIEVEFSTITCIIRGTSFGRISKFFLNQLNHSNLLVVFLAIIMLASAKTNFPAVNFVCSCMVANWVYLNLKVSDGTPKWRGYFGQSYILRCKNEANDIFYHQIYRKKFG